MYSAHEPAGCENVYNIPVIYVLGLIKSTLNYYRFCQVVFDKIHNFSLKKRKKNSTISLEVENLAVEDLSQVSPRRRKAFGTSCTTKSHTVKAMQNDWYDRIGFIRRDETEFLQQSVSEGLLLSVSICYIGRLAYRLGNITKKKKKIGGKKCVVRPSYVSTELHNNFLGNSRFSEGLEKLARLLIKVCNILCESTIHVNNLKSNYSKSDLYLISQLACRLYCILSGICGIWFHKFCITNIKFHDFEDVSIEFLKSWITSVESRESIPISLYKYSQQDHPHIGSSATELPAIDFHKYIISRIYLQEFDVLDSIERHSRRMNLGIPNCITCFDLQKMFNPLPSINFFVSFIYEALYSVRNNNSNSCPHALTMT
ncbi:hypothetical protein WN51_09706 [Melipona quadrifasciata]|uniref:Uncharacterized protein n=1 Tax=Melipona quadrifasciata TaxID=166423 RepID=A0A0N0BI96_9HYME|nr:hypothetical protein WN51_09706 [Melipona quadrifasciata]